MNKNLRMTGALVLVALTGLAGCGKQTQNVGSSGEQSAIIGGQEFHGIIGGSDSDGNEEFAKTMAAVFNTAQGSLCTASILSDTILLTAAHCVDGPSSSLRVVFGPDIRDPQTRIIQKVEEYKVSPLWPFRQSEELNTGDVAIVRYSGGLPVGFKPATLLTDVSKLANGTTVLLAGYGQSNGVTGTGSGRLRYVEVAIEDNKFSESEVLLDQRQGKGACHGDSGGPAYVKVDGKLLLWGITNRGINDPRNDCSVSAAYASVLFYASWIQRTAAQLERNARPALLLAQAEGF
jgi:secreted trypsin-like serine protease